MHYTSTHVAQHSNDENQTQENQIEAVCWRCHAHIVVDLQNTIPQMSMHALCVTTERTHFVLLKEMASSSTANPNLYQYSPFLFRTPPTLLPQRYDESKLRVVDLKGPSRRSNSNNDNPDNDIEVVTKVRRSNTSAEGNEYADMTVRHLRDMCKRRGLKVGGTKKVIIKRLKEDDAG